jgi:hypothetical protein
MGLLPLLARSSSQWRAQGSTYAIVTNLTLCPQRRLLKIAVAHANSVYHCARAAQGNEGRLGSDALLQITRQASNHHAVFYAAVLLVQPRGLHAARNVLPRLPRLRPDATLSPKQLQLQHCCALPFTFDRPGTVIAIHPPSTCLPRENRESQLSHSAY